MSAGILPAVAAGLGGLLGSMYIDSKLLLSKDFSQIKDGALAQIKCKIWESQGRLHYYYRFKEKAKANPENIFVIFEGKEYTYRKIEKVSNRLAHWLLAQNVKKGDIVCMMLQNHPTFFILLFAICKIGAIPSLINTNLSDESLLHCVKVADTRFFFFDSLYADQAATIVDACRDINVKLYCYGESTEDANIDPVPFASPVTPNLLSNYSEKDTSEEYLKGVGLGDPAYLIYTSGTTGMPKAAISQHFRVSFASTAYGRVTGIGPNDRLYNVLPLYHSSGLIVACGTAFFNGATIVLGRKFSASRFWDDIVNYKVTSFVYIGEFCRYLLTQTPHPQEKNHNIRVVYGNGMRPDVWTRFRERFNIPTICELYAATEGPGGLINVNTGEIGATAVGFRGKFFRAIKREVQIIKIDPISEEPVRDKDGFCVNCDYDEPGEFLVRLDDDGPVRFDGYYKNKGATNKKILTDVFVKGDKYFRSGDLLRYNSDGYYYFCDRIGDTFRWKSENVATTEVAQALGVYPGIAEANVYGALIPKHDGRAGMAALVLQEGTSLDFTHLCNYLRQKLPKYAVPIFIRFTPSLNMTGTFKQQKVELRNQGIDLSKIPETDAVFWLKGDTYVPFTIDDYAQFESGNVKL